MRAQSDLKTNIRPLDIKEIWSQENAGAYFEIVLLEAELNSLEAEKRNSVRIYQDFCDRNLELKKREDELQRNIDEMENKKAELQKTTELQLHLAELQKNTYRNNLNPEVKQENIIQTNDKFIPPPSV